MNITNVAIIGGALAMDACGVALSIGINCQVTTSKKIRFILAFAFFQFFLAFVRSFEQNGIKIIRKKS